MKILFVSIRDVSKKNSGGEKCTNRNFLSLCELAGNDNVEVVDISQFREKSTFLLTLRRLSFFLGCYAGLSMRIIRLIIGKSVDFDYVFIDVSYLGIIARYLRKAGYRGTIISFFHNVELSIMKQKSTLNPLESWKLFVIHYNERMAVRYSDSVVALTKRDATELARIYKANTVRIIPVSLPDECSCHDSENTAYPLTLLFIGDNWYPNISGLRWFIKYVLNEVDITLQIVGRNMEAYRQEFSHPKIEFLGFVEDLTPLIIHADYILCPIFTGGGMKVKVCEALMYGKNLIATREALEGYDVKHAEVGIVCNFREEFISGIQKLAFTPRARFNRKSREYYLNQYSFEATLGLFKELLSARKL